MEFKDIWSQLCRKKPLLVDGTSTIEITSNNLQDLLKQVYEQGRNAVPKIDPTSKNDFGKWFGM